MYTLGDLSCTLERLAPLYLAEKWDNVGIMLGSRAHQIDKVLCALDINDEVIEEAISKKVDCIITHHPFIFGSMKKLDFDSSKGKQIYKLIKNDIAVYSMHTNFDITKGGINDLICEKLGMGEVASLETTYTEKVFKVAIYAPRESEEAIKQVITAHNTCTTGNYKGCNFASEGIGSFVPLEGSDPYEGTVGKLSTAEEVKIEFMTSKHEVDGLIEKIKEVHPYEEMAYDIYTLENIHRKEGIGRYGRVESINIKELIEKLKALFKVSHVRVCGELDQEINKIAVCSGSGSQYMKYAACVADVFITGDMKFHEAQGAKEMGLTVIDVGHYASENIAMPLIKEYLENEYSHLQVECSNIDGEMFKTI